MEKKKMTKMNKALILSNPFLYIFGVPIITGFVLAAMFDGVCKKTEKIIGSIDI